MSTPNLQYYKDFVKTIEPLIRRHDRGRVFSDFLTLAICSFHQINIQTQLREKDEANEALYMETLSPYKKDEINTFPKLLGIFTASANDEPYSDILGEYFTEHITNGQNGQYFTPSAVCEMMVRMQGEPNTIEGKTVADPACGSGRLLLAFAKTNPNNYFFGTDNANTCAKMTTLNFFINGLRGEVAQMNTLTMEWYKGWHINMNGLGIVPIEKEQSRIWSAPPKVEQKTIEIPELPSGQSKQLTLF